MALTQELREANGEMWERMVGHPFVQELALGTLPRRKFRAYFIQDCLFIGALVQTVALAIAKAPDAEATRPLEAFLRTLLTAEDDLFRRAFTKLGVPESDWRAAAPAPTTLALGSYLKATASLGTFEEIAAALLVTEWTYYDWATRCVAEGSRPADPVYQEWIDIHAARELGQFVAFLRRHLDSADLPPVHRERVAEVFTRVLRYEVAFWDMAYHGEEPQ